MPSGMEMGMDMGPDDTGPMDAFETEARAAFPEKEWTPEQVMAFKEAIKICLEQDQAGDYDKPPAGPPKKGPDLAIVFGGPEKKKK